MKTLTFLLVALLASLISARGVSSSAVRGVTVYSPPSSYKVPRTLYARTLLLSKQNATGDVLLATWENYSEEPPYFPIYRSTDLGNTWSELSRVKDTVNGWGLRYQPFLYELPVPFGGFPAGTLLLAGSSIPEDLSITQIDLYASTNKGANWTFVSHVARGGEAIPNNGETPVWEPFIMMWQDRLIVYYSDQRDPRYGQKMDHQSTRDLRRWDPPVDDIAVPAYNERPGMPTIAALPNGCYIMTYEAGNASPVSFAVYYRIASDPTKFLSAPVQKLRTTDGTVPVGSPYVVWTPAGGPNGTIVVTSGGASDVYLNRRLGATSAWIRRRTSAPASYTRSLLVMPKKQDILIVGGGVLNGENNTVNANTVNVAA
ncbi:glycoside hydrolase family 93 protein [Aulographum hederae CBS 113979]|uniref:Glycoside hydrolase family 93 protein n=1 Tax=Aulographum hederae CBS 113979 TaxID=1176131 RepID=A0A6G1H1W5_9PEZI|nr:glycoside hydrolase family 93 protein [Aulographum hederae CBS 113979]